jgi:hypothetical protein
MGGVEVHLVPGDHVDMMSMPHVHAVADKLAAYLDGSSNHQWAVCWRGLTPSPYQAAIGAWPSASILMREWRISAFQAPDV